MQNTVNFMVPRPLVVLGAYEADDLWGEYPQINDHAALQQHI